MFLVALDQVMAHTTWQHGPGAGKVKRRLLQPVNVTVLSLDTSALDVAKLVRAAEQQGRGWGKGGMKVKDEGQGDGRAADRRMAAMVALGGG